MPAHLDDNLVFNSPEADCHGVTKTTVIMTTTATNDRYSDDHAAMIMMHS